MCPMFLVKYWNITFDVPYWFLFQSVACTGFRNVVATAIQIGATLGNVSVDDILAEPRTISRNLESHVEHLREKMKEEVENVSNLNRENE